MNECMHECMHASMNRDRIEIEIEWIGWVYIVL